VDRNPTAGSEVSLQAKSAASIAAGCSVIDLEARAGERNAQSTIDARGEEAR